MGTFPTGSMVRGGHRGRDDRLTMVRRGINGRREGHQYQQHCGGCSDRYPEWHEGMAQCRRTLRNDPLDLPHLTTQLVTVGEASLEQARAPGLSVLSTYAAISSGSKSFGESVTVNLGMGRAMPH